MISDISKWLHELWNEKKVLEREKEKVKKGCQESKKREWRKYFYIYLSLLVLSIDFNILT